MMIVRPYGDRGRTATIAALALLLVPHFAMAQLRGAGATFPAPIYTQWFAKYKQDTNTSVDYQAVGSGAGYNAIKNKTVDFGASDAPLTEAEEKAMPGAVVHIPTVGGAVVLTYNIPGIGAGLRFTPEIIAGIFLGKIHNWNDPQIAKVNPRRTLPALEIQSVHRTEGSGTTYIFTHYLKKASTEWAAGPGAGKSVSWPVGLGGKGNDGVSAGVSRTAGAIGYVELAYAIDKHLPYGQVLNHAGVFVSPSVASTTAAINQYIGELRQDIKTPTVDAPGKNSYPICSLTYVLIYKQGGEKAARLFEWAMKPAQQEEAKTLYYAPLPPALVKLNEQTLHSIH